MQKGNWVGKVIFPELSSPLRTDERFIAMLDTDYHHGPSPLAKLKVGLVSQMPLDYMHLVCLGVTRRLLHFWTRPPHKYRMQPSKVQHICKYLIELQCCFPKEFCRKPRSLQLLDRWKATEFRHFLLYTDQLYLKMFWIHASMRTFCYCM